MIVFDWSVQHWDDFDRNVLYSGALSQYKHLP